MIIAKATATGDAGHGPRHIQHARRQALRERFRAMGR